MGRPALCLHHAHHPASSCFRLPHCPHVRLPAPLEGPLGRASQFSLLTDQSLRAVSCLTALLSPICRVTLGQSLTLSEPVFSSEPSFTRPVSRPGEMHLSSAHSPHPLDQDNLPTRTFAPIFQMQTLRYIETRAVQEA